MERLSFYDLMVWNHFFNSGEVVEIRILNATGHLDGQRIYRKTLSGYFDNHPDFYKALKLLKKLVYSGCYFTLHVIDPRLIGRAFNRIKVSDIATSKKDILAYRWLPLDFDPVRPTGISSTDIELRESLELRELVVPIVRERYGFSSPVLAMSGNGCHALFRLPDWPVDQENQDILKGLLKVISDEFSTDAVTIDQSVWDPPRIWKLYGTVGRKGDSVPAGPYREARPHRKSFIETLGSAY